MDLDSASSASDNLFGASPVAAPNPEAEGPQAEANPETHEADPSQQQARESATYAQMEQLHQTDAKLAQLVSVASEAVAALHPTSDLELDPSSSWHASEAQGQLAKDKTELYYALLNDIQIELRSTIRALRRSKASTLPATNATYAPASTPFGVLASSVAPGAVQPAGEANSGLGLGGTKVQSRAWEGLNDALKELSQVK